MKYNEIKNYVITIYNKTIIVKKFSTFIIQDTSYIFLGYITKYDLIPNINCIYINEDDKCILHRINKSKIQFTIDGAPHGKGRPRFRRFGNFVSTYTDNKTVQIETKIKNIFNTLKNLPKIANNTPVSVSIDFQMPIPTSLSKKKQNLLLLKPCLKKPDLDNLIKSVLDALNKQAYSDDSLIYNLNCKKYYSDTPKTIVNLIY